MSGLIEKLVATLLAWEAWEADIILYGDWSGDCVRLTQAQHDSLTPLQEQRTKVLLEARSTGVPEGWKVKALEWEAAGGDGTMSFCATPIGLRYYAYRAAGEWHSYTEGYPSSSFGISTTLDEAKAACQADYSARILSALVLPPQPEPAPEGKDEATPDENFLTPEEEAEIVADINSGRWPYLHPARQIAEATPAVEAGPEAARYQFDRYINGKLMAEGVWVSRAASIENAAMVSARIATRGPNGEVPVLVLRQHPAPITREAVEALNEARHGIYIASKTTHADRWRFLRDKIGLPIISTWIDEAGQGQSANLNDLWQRCVAEAGRAAVFILYREKDEVLKGAWIELGAALAAGAKVFAVGIEDFTVAHDKRITHCRLMKDAIGSARKYLSDLETAAGSEGGAT